LRKREKGNGLFLLLKNNLDENKFLQNLSLWRKNYNERWIMGSGDGGPGFGCHGTVLSVPESVRKNIRNEVQQ
jgi:hypothetical protein